MKLQKGEKEIDLASEQSENGKATAKRELYLSTLEAIASKDKGFFQLLLRIKSGLANVIDVNDTTTLNNTIVAVSKDPKRQPAANSGSPDLAQKVQNYERVMKEMKKQIAGQKTEIQQIKQMEQFLSLDNYQKLINEFNTLYEHYKGLKQINKKMKVELKQSNTRERTFLKLLKRTQEYGDQATKLEQEYDRLFKEDQRLGLSVENLIIDSNDRREPELMDKGGVMIPKLDLSSIFIQREALPSNTKDEGEDDETSDDEEEYDQEGGPPGDSKDPIDSKAKKNKFEQQKKDFKMRMLKGQAASAAAAKE